MFLESPSSGMLKVNEVYYSFSEHLSSPPVLCGAGVPQSLIFCVVSCQHLFFVLSIALSDLLLCTVSLVPSNFSSTKYGRRYWVIGLLAVFVTFNNLWAISWLSDLINTHIVCIIKFKANGSILAVIVHLCFVVNSRSSMHVITLFYHYLFYNVI